MYVTTLCERVSELSNFKSKVNNKMNKTIASRKELFANSSLANKITFSRQKGSSSVASGLKGTKVTI